MEGKRTFIGIGVTAGDLKDCGCRRAADPGIVRELPDCPCTNTQCFCGDFDSNVGLKNQGATVVVRNPLSLLVAGAWIGLWKRAELGFHFLLRY
jgi:hypothetical protein